MPLRLQMASRYVSTVQPSSMGAPQTISCWTTSRAPRTFLHLPCSKWPSRLCMSVSQLSVGCCTRRCWDPMDRQACRKLQSSCCPLAACMPLCVAGLVRSCMSAEGNVQAVARGWQGVAAVTRSSPSIAHLSCERVLQQKISIVTHGLCRRLTIPLDGSSTEATLKPLQRDLTMYNELGRMNPLYKASAVFSPLLAMAFAC